jgi:hypothetical protein
VTDIAKLIVSLVEAIAKLANADEAELLKRLAEEAQRKAFASDAAWKKHLENLEID